MTPEEIFQTSLSACLPSLYHPGGHTLRIKLLVLLLALQRIIVPIDTGSNVVSVFTGNVYKVRRMAQVLFPWNVQEQHPFLWLCEERCLPGWPRVLVCKLQKFCCCYVLLLFYRIKKSTAGYKLVYILQSVCYSLFYDGNVQFKFQEMETVYPDLTTPAGMDGDALPPGLWDGTHCLLCNRGGETIAGQAHVWYLG